MDIFLLSLILMAAGAVLSGIIALRPVTAANNRAANIMGPASAAAACILGLLGVFSGGWTGTENFLLHWGLPFGAFALGLDSLSRLFLLPVFVLGFTCALSGSISLRHSDPAEHNLGAHWLFYLLLLLGMTCVLTARDALFFMLSWELMSLSPFFLIDFNDRDRLVQDASWVYLVAAHLGAVLLIAFFAMLWQQTGSTLFSAMTLHTPEYSTLLFLLALLGFGAKIGLTPLHVWLPEAHPAAPSHVSALLSGAMLNAGLYGLIRSFDFLGTGSSLPAWWGWLLIAVGIATALMGILKALGQSNLKRLLAYSSAENMGLMVMAVGIGLIGICNNNTWMAALGFSGCLFHMLNHSAFKGLLFLCAGEVLHSVGTVSMTSLGGLQKRMPFLGALFALGAASIACLPPFNGFAGEFVISLSLIKGLALTGMEQKIALLVCLTGLMLVSGISAAVYIKAYGLTFLGQPRTQFAAEPHVPQNRFLLPLLIPAFACVLGGFCAKWVFLMIQPTISYISAVPHSLAASSEAVIAGTDEILGLIAGFGTAGLMAAVLFIGLRRILLVRNGKSSAPTWGCGYQYGTSRIQYTPASFAEPGTRIFSAVMGTSVKFKKDDRYFPSHASLSVKTPDVVRGKLYAPLFELIERGCNSLKILQNGLVNMYILYILITLVLLLVWGVAA
jgi:formate hydrogenlyase subunit 3/multisubunit Na+/H+ antiporter MnhD subunit